MEIRKLGPGDADLARAAVERFKRNSHDLASWLASDRHLMLVALEGRSPIGWVYGYELPRVDRDESMWLLYEIDVATDRRRRGIGAALLNRFRELADGPVWLVSNRSNSGAMALYAAGEQPNGDDVVVRFKSE